MSYGYPDQQRPRLGSRLLSRLIIVVVLAAIPLGSLLLKGCQKGPFGRSQVVALNPQQEEQLGLQAFQEVLSQERVMRQGPLVDAIKDIAQRLTDAARHEGFLSGVQMPEQEMQWDVRVIESHEQNAFCLPGGKIVVYTGILPIAETNTGLAVVMGHEIAHALAHHGAERMAQQQIAQIGVMAAGGALGDMDPNARQQVLQMINAGAKFGILKYSRGHESEADHMGLLLMAAAGYDPRESMRFWERMQQFAGGKSPPEFLSTHPSHETRIQDLKSWLPEAMPLYDGSQKVETKKLPSPDFRGI
ncbi:MAG: M48 family metallopeptidase [Pirellulales bacterium]